jgi:hypothetical protein
VERVLNGILFLPPDAINSVEGQDCWRKDLTGLRDIEFNRFATGLARDQLRSHEELDVGQARSTDMSLNLGKLTCDFDLEIGSLKNRYVDAQSNY